MNIREWCKRIIEGAGGLRAYYAKEARSTPKQQDCVEWAVKCLANPSCEGSGEVIKLILEQRASMLGMGPDRVALLGDREANRWLRRLLGVDVPERAPKPTVRPPTDKG